MNIVENLIIVGAGSAAREILQLIKEVNKVKETYLVRGFIDDAFRNIKELTNGEFDIIGSIKEWKPSSDELYVCAISNPLARKTIVEKLEARGAKFIGLVHPSVLIGDYSRVGKGLIAYAYASIGPNVNIGDHVFLQRTSIAHDVIVGSYTTISSLCGILGGVEIGSEVFVGNHATLLPNIKIGDKSFVGAGSVVIRNVAENSKVFGNPARKVDF
jgi:sugar O-acyltransferase (sialic acid O-acetyltransferase NeuD family)